MTNPTALLDPATTRQLLAYSATDYYDRAEFIRTHALTPTMVMHIAGARYENERAHFELGKKYPNDAALMQYALSRHCPHIARGMASAFTSDEIGTLIFAHDTSGDYEDRWGFRSIKKAMMEAKLQDPVLVSGMLKSPDAQIRLAASQQVDIDGAIELILAVPERETLPERTNVIRRFADDPRMIETVFNLYRPGASGSAELAALAVSTRDPEVAKRLRKLDPNRLFTSHDVRRWWINDPAMVGWMVKHQFALDVFVKSTEAPDLLKKYLPRLRTLAIHGGPNLTKFDQQELATALIPQLADDLEFAQHTSAYGAQQTRSLAVHTKSHRVRVVLADSEAARTTPDVRQALWQDTHSKSLRAKLAQLHAADQWGPSTPLPDANMKLEDIVDALYERDLIVHDLAKQVWVAKSREQQTSTPELGLELSL